MGSQIKDCVKQRYLNEISKLSIVYENLVDEKTIRCSDEKIKNIRLFDAIEAYFLELSHIHIINIDISNFQLIDHESKIIINRIKNIENIEVEFN